MAVNVEMWQPLIIGNLYAANEFMAVAHNADEYVIGGRVVHIPQAGAPSPVQKNRSVLPATVTKRADTDVVYALDEYTTDPKLITDIDKKELSYDKRESIVREDTGNMMEVVGDNMLYDWSDAVPVGNIIASTGVAGAATASGATGTRKAITENDFFEMMTRMDLQNIPREGRYALLTSNQNKQLMQEAEVKKFTQIVIDRKTGRITELAGFKIMHRSKVVRVAANDTVKLPTAANAVTDDEAAVFFHSQSVEKAVGDVMIFDNYGRVEYYGDLVSFLLRAKGRRRRADNKGFFLLRNVAA